MPYIYKDTVNIYDDEAIARAIHTQETQFQVLQGKISSLITDSELEVLRNGGSTMYSRMSSTEQTVEGITTQVSNIQTDLRDNRPTISSMNSAITQKATEITTSVNQTLQNYSTTSQMNTAIQQSASSITQTASQTYVTKTDYNTLVTRVGTAESKITPTAIINTVTSSDGVTAMVSAINQSADTVKIQAAHINLIGAVTANCIATGAVTAAKIDVDDLFAQDITATGTITGATLSGGTITGGSISGGSIDGATVTGGTISGSRIESNTGKIGGWNLSASGFTSENGAISILSSAPSLHDNYVSIGSLSINGYGVMSTGDINCNGDLLFSSYGDLPVVGGVSAKGIMLGHDATLESHETRIGDLETTVGGHTTSIADHETRIGNLESAPAPEYPRSPDFLRVQVDDNLTVDHTISCTTLSVSGTATANKFKGSYDNGTGTIAVWSGGELKGQSSSSRRYKKDMGLVNVSQAREVLNVPVVNFQYKAGYLADGDEKEGVTIPGFFAEDVERCIPEAVYHNKDGKVENWMERIMLPLMLRVIQDQQHRIEELERKR